MKRAMLRQTSQTHNNSEKYDNYVKILPHRFSFVETATLVTDANNDHDKDEENNAQTDMTNK
jgi:hypothetical protein